MPQNTDYHVWEEDGQWHVKRENASRKEGSYSTKVAALRRACQLAKNTGGAVRLHNANTGRFEPYTCP